VYQDHSQLFRGIATADPENNFGSYLRSGRHVLGLLKYEVKPTQEGQTIIAAECVMLETTPAPGARPHAVGEIVSLMWRMTGLSKDWQRKNENARAQSFQICVLDAQAHVAQLNTLPPVADPQTGQMISQGQLWLMGEAFNLTKPEQPGRGRVLIAIGGAPVYSKDQAKAQEQMAKGEGYVPVTYQAASGSNVPEMIAQRRAQWDAQFGPPQLFSQMGARPPVQGGASFGHAMQQVPPPAAPPGAWQGHGVQPAPQPAQPGYGAPMQMPQQGYGAPAPAPMQPGYGAPPMQQPGAPVQPAPAPAPQQWQQPPAQVGTPYGAQPGQAPAPQPGGMLPPGFK
jgi:hypothetical protein